MPLLAIPWSLNMFIFNLLPFSIENTTLSSFCHVLKYIEFYLEQGLFNASSAEVSTRIALTLRLQ